EIAEQDATALVLRRGPPWCVERVMLRGADVVGVVTWREAEPAVARLALPAVGGAGPRNPVPVAEAAGAPKGRPVWQLVVGGDPALRGGGDPDARWVGKRVDVVA